MAYKKLIKVSNVCQLLDKSKYPATKTINGVTFTNNGDGTFTVNGTSTVGSGFILDTFYIEGNRTYLMTGCPEGGGAGKYFMFDGYSKLGSDLGSGVIKTVSGSDRTLCSPILYVVTGQTVSNLVFKPQLFDLTEMYGAGHEPTTVEQFRADFPNELYDYSPRCWLTSYKRVIVTGNETYPVLTSYQRNLTCKTKNLFDNIVPANNCRVSFATSRAIATQIVADTDTTGLFKIVSYNGASYEVLSWIRDVLTLGRMTSTFTTPETTGYKHIVFGLNGAKIDTTCLCEINLKPSTTYTFSCNFTNITQGSISWTDMQLEEGSTATDYVPYGHL